MYNYLIILKKYVIIKKGIKYINKSDLNNLDLKIAMHKLLEGVCMMKLKKLLVLSSLLGLISCGSSNHETDLCYADKSGEIKQFNELQDKLNLLGVYDFKKIKKLSRALNKCSIDNNVLIGIIMLESSFKIDSYNYHSKDYGLMQVNEWHVRRSSLSRLKLLTSVKYNVKHGCKILKWFLDNYEFKEAIMRYNVGTSKHAIYSFKAIEYYENFNKYYEIIKD